ncbi:MAG TPA: hypothetical protein VF103_09340 [Polyangiaceae bacterium]
MARITFVSLTLLAAACSPPPAPSAPQPSAPAPPPPPAAEPSPGPIASVASAPSDAYIPPSERCDPMESAGSVPSGWPRATLAEVASRKRPAKVEVEATLESVVPGYDCGGSPAECEGKLKALELVLTDASGARLTALGSPSERGRDFLPGHRYQFSLWACNAKDGSPMVLVRGQQILDREAGAPAACAPLESMPKTKLEAWPLRPLAALDRNQVLPGGFNTEGFVVSRFVPTPCPPKVVCAPQPPPHVVIADAPTDGKASIVLQTPRPDRIALGKVAVSAALCSTRSFGAVNEGFLVAIERR